MTFNDVRVGGYEEFSEPVSFRNAYHEATGFAHDPKGWLVISGPSGGGKTLLAAAITNFLISNKKAVRYDLSSNLIDQLRSSFDNESDEDFSTLFSQFLDAPVLVLDDLGHQSDTPWANEKLDQVLTNRFNKRLPTVITTSVPRDELDNRTLTRFSDPYFSKYVHIKQGRKKTQLEETGISPRLLSKMTLKNFNSRGAYGTSVAAKRTLKEALDVAKSFAEQPSGWLYLHGPTGVVKTGVDVIFRFVPDLLDQLRKTYDPKSISGFDQTFDRIRNCEVLILDDLGAEVTTSWVEEKLFQIIVHRHNEMLSTVITSRIDLSDNDNDSKSINISTRFAEPIISRLRDAHVVTERYMHAPDFRYRGSKNNNNR